MILLIEQDKTIRKKLCDLLNRERIIAVETRQQILEALVRHKNVLNAVVANIRSVHDILTEETIAKLCEKLIINVPPIIAFWQNGEEKLVQEVDKRTLCTFLKYDAKDVNFPSKYTKAIKKVHPGLHIDLGRANQVWLESDDTQDLVDIRSWLKEEGFIEGIKKDAASKKAKSSGKKAKEADQVVNYKEKYLELKKEYDELKKKHDELLKYFKDLTDSV